MAKRVSYRLPGQASGPLWQHAAARSCTYHATGGVPIHGRAGVPVPQSGVGPPGPIPNPVVKHTSARWYCPARAGEEAGAGTPARLWLAAVPVAFFLAPCPSGRGSPARRGSIWSVQLLPAPFFVAHRTVAEPFLPAMQAPRRRGGDASEPGASRPGCPSRAIAGQSGAALPLDRRATPRAPRHPPDVRRAGRRRPAPMGGNLEMV